MPGASPARVAYLGQVQPSGFVLPLRAIDVVTMGRFAARGLLGRMSREDRRLAREGMARMGVADLADEAAAATSRAASASACTWRARSPGGPTC